MPTKIYKTNKHLKTFLNEAANSVSRRGDCEGVSISTQGTVSDKLNKLDVRKNVHTYQPRAIA